MVSSGTIWEGRLRRPSHVHRKGARGLLVELSERSKPALFLVEMSRSLSEGLDTPCIKVKSLLLAASHGLARRKKQLALDHEDLELCHSCQTTVRIGAPIVSHLGCRVQSSLMNCQALPDMLHRRDNDGMHCRLHDVPPI